MILGLTGTARSGKNAVAKILAEHVTQPVCQIQIAAPLKKFCRETFDWTEVHTDGALKDVPDTRYPRECWKCSGTGRGQTPDGLCPHCKGAKITYLTPREAMQTLGDEWTTPLFPNIWALKAAKAAKVVENEGGIAVVTDCRFIRDLEEITKVGGTIIQLHRGDGGLIGDASRHRGEVEWNRPEFQAMVEYHFHNHGTLDDLEVQVLTRLGITPMAPRHQRER